MINTPSPLETIEGQSNTYKWTPTTIVLHGEAVAAVLVLPTSLKMCLVAAAAGHRMGSVHGAQRCVIHRANVEPTIQTGGPDLE